MNAIKSLLISVCLTSLYYTGTAQTATIYYLGIEVDPILVEFNKVEDNSRNWLNGVSTSEVFPGYLIDSIKNQTVQIISQFSRLEPTICPLPSTKFFNISAPNHIDSLPHFNLNKAFSECQEAQRYIWIYAHLIGTEKKATLFSDACVVLTVEINYKVYNKDKKAIAKAKTTLKDFGHLYFETINEGSIELRNAEVLSSQDIYELYLLALTAALNK